MCWHGLSASKGWPVHESVSGRLPGRGLGIDAHRFEASPSVQARYDLEYAHASICSPEVLCLFTDEFDWQDLHNDFVPGARAACVVHPC